MIGSFPISDSPISDFVSGSLYVEFVSEAGFIIGGTVDGYGKEKGYDSTGGLLVGGAFVSRVGAILAGGYPIYGDVLLGDMPYLVRQTESVGGFVFGGEADYVRNYPYTFAGGFVVGGECEYTRVSYYNALGGFVVGGYGDEEGDFSKVILVYFSLKWPECLFVPPSERLDIPNILRSLE